MDFKIVGITNIKVKGRWRDCLCYSTIDKNGVVTDGGIVTLDMKWIFCCISPSITKDTWVKLRYYPKLNIYGFPDPEKKRDKPYTLYRKLIDIVDSIVIERELL